MKVSLVEKQTEKLRKQIVELENTNAALVDRVKLLESALMQAEMTSQAKSDYLENMNHEIRTSMHGIVGMTSLVLETELSPEQQQYLEMVNASVDRLLEVVSEVLDFSKIESGQLDLKARDFNLKESLDHDLYLLRGVAEQKGLGLTCSIDPDVPDFVHSDPKRLVQIITNLVRNGIQYTEHGAVSIFVKNDGYDERKRLCLHFSVHDTGVGIDLEKQKQIFHTFCRTESRQPAYVGGAGIGLTICSQLVKLMGGEIGLASSAKGSVFWFSLPFTEVADLGVMAEVEDSPVATGTTETATYALQGARVLLAEDDPINRVLTETLLSQAGAEVTSVENGKQAVEKALSEDFQVVLMDVQMPVLDGLEATRSIRESEKDRGNRMTIVALTALAMQGDREKCLQAGMDDYLPKPIDKFQLIDMLSKYLTSTALVVDSDVVSQQVVVRSLIERGWSVTIAETDRSVMYEASLNHFDLILLDTAMVQMDTIEAARVIRKLEEYTGQHAMIVGIGPGGKEEQKQWLESGVDGYIARPVTGEKLYEKLQQIES